MTKASYYEEKMRQKLDEFLIKQDLKKKTYYEDKLQEIYSKLDRAVETFIPDKRNFITVSVDVSDQEVARQLLVKLSEEDFSVETVNEFGYGIRYLLVSVMI